MSSLRFCVCVVVVLCAGSFNMARAQEPVTRDQTKEIEQLRREVADLKQVLEAQRADFNKALEQISKQVQGDAKLLLKQVQELMTKNDKLANELTASQAENKALKARLSHLEQALAERTRELVQLKVKLVPNEKPEPKEPGPNEPRAKVDGNVVRFDAKANLILIDRGSDEGVERGQRFHVMRLGKQPVYLGEFQVIQVVPKQSIASPVGRVRGEPKAGDVATTELQDGK